MKIMSEEEIKSQFQKKNIDLKEYSKVKVYTPEPISAGSKGKTITFLVDAVNSICNVLRETLSHQQNDSQESKKVIYSLFSKLINLHEKSNQVPKTEVKLIESHTRSPCKWKFKINRDSQGRIESIEAEPENY